MRNNMTLAHLLIANGLDKTTVADRCVTIQRRGFGSVGSSFKIFNKEGRELSISHENQVAIFELMNPNRMTRVVYPASPEELLKVLAEHLGYSISNQVN